MSYIPTVEEVLAAHALQAEFTCWKRERRRRIDIRLRKHLARASDAFDKARVDGVIPEVALTLGVQS
jgi:hypothetical protein